VSVAAGVVPDSASSSPAAAITHSARAALKPGMAVIVSTDAVASLATVLMRCSANVSAAAGPMPVISVMTGFTFINPLSYLIQGDMMKNQDIGICLNQGQ
jgi:hypothetical protein